MYIIAHDYSFNCTNRRYRHGRKIKKKRLQRPRNFQIIFHAKLVMREALEDDDN